MLVDIVADLIVLIISLCSITLSPESSITILIARAVKTTVPIMIAIGKINLYTPVNRSIATPKAILSIKHKNPTIRENLNGDPVKGLKKIITEATSKMFV